MRFAEPQYLYIILCLPFVYLFFYFLNQRMLKKIEKHLDKKMIQFLTRSISTESRKWKKIIQFLGVSFICLALARPQFGKSTQTVKSQGVEVILALDVSESMLVEDVRPSRLDQMKTEMSRLVEMLEGNKVGIVGFAGSAVLLSPLTTDPSALKMFIESVGTDSVSTQGTQFKKAIQTAKDAFNRGGIDNDETTQVTKVLIIASDGEDHDDIDIKETQALVEAGIKVFTLAYGTEKGGVIPERDQNGYLRGYKKDPQTNQPVLSQVKGEVLKKIAQEGKGSFYHASFGGDHLKNIVEDLRKLEKTEFDSTTAVQYEEKYQIFLLVGFILLLVEFILGERHNQFKLWRGRFEQPTR